MQQLLLNLRSRGSLLWVLLACFATVELAVAQFPPAVMVDRYLMQAEREMGSGEPVAALETFERVLELQSEQGVDIPEVFWFRRAQAGYEAGRLEVTLESLVRYIEISGQGGEQYLAALELYDVAELAKVEADELAAALAAAEAERLAADEEALTAAVAAVAPEMVVIPAGSFRMGCVSGENCDDDELPVHEVTIPEAFAVSVYEVTFAQWDACVLGGGCGGYRPDDYGWGRGTRPVMNVSWDDAQEYVGWLSGQTGESYRLLSESEWEYVARAGTSTAYSWGNAIGSSRANCDGCGDQWEYTAPVGSFPPNAYGVHDMHGNVWEWVEDCWNGSYAGASSDGSAWLRGDCGRRVLRGGSWYYDPWYLRSAYRLGDTSGYRFFFNGFRVARTLTP